MRTYLAAITAAVWILGPIPALAQDIPWPRGDRLAVDARLESATFHRASGLLELRYEFANRSASEQSARFFVVTARAPVVSIEAPAGERPWLTVGPVAGDSVVFWGPGARTQDLLPGDRRSGFAILARGLPDIVPFWVEGRYETPSAPIGQEDRVAASTPLKQNSFTALTVGPVAVSTVDLPDLLQRLQGLTRQTCELEWVANVGVCRSLQTKLDQASRSLQRGNPEAARDQLRSFLEELDAQHGDEPGKHVTDNAYWLLRINAEFLLSTL